MGNMQFGYNMQLQQFVILNIVKWSKRIFTLAKL